ncbi:MAG: GNAT family N-acetyltransferase [Lachnospiraceae bacterium]|nr:GNAT family N-acetyltransferase [Lachnospiraceae bacterium]
MNAPVDISTTILETERLILRPWRESDLEDFFEYASVDGVGQMAGWNPHQSKEESARILKSFIEHKKTFALELKENRKVIGSLGLETCRPEPDEPYKSRLGRELGYVLGKAYWGQGLMPEAVSRVIRYCLEELHYDFVQCGHFVENNQSRRVIEKCGFHLYRTAEFTGSNGVSHESRIYLIDASGSVPLKTR